MTLRLPATDQWICPVAVSNRPQKSDANWSPAELVQTVKFTCRNSDSASR